MRRPGYRRILDNPDNRMEMIRHDHEGIQFYSGKMDGNFIPTGSHNITVFIQPHFTVLDFSKQAFPIFHAHGYEIGARVGVIVSS